MKNVFYQLFDEDMTRVSLMFEKGTPYEAAVNRLVDEEEKLLATLNAEQEQLPGRIPKRSRTCLTSPAGRISQRASSWGPGS